MRFSSGDRNRTCDTQLMSLLLYRLSYAALDWLEKLAHDILTVNSRL